MWDILLGHNPLFGIHHGSSKAAMERSLRFQDAGAIVEFVERAMEAGIAKMMMSTHPKAAEFREAVLRNGSPIKREMTFYPLVPYMQKYVRAANENGIVSMLSDMVGQMGLRKSAAVFIKAGFSKLFNDIRGMLESLLELEMATFQGLLCDRVFLHNALTDLAVALNAREPIEIFKNYVENKLGLKVGFGTLNLPFALRRFAEWELAGQYFMAPFNKLGHQMNPDLASNIAALDEFRENRVLAMSTLASGQLHPEQAYEFLARISSIDAVVVGISSQTHLRSTTSVLNDSRIQC